jgi:predicted transcriptional regulator
MPVQHRQRLDELAASTGLSPSALARLAVRELVERRDVVLRLLPEDQQAA